MATTHGTTAQSRIVGQKGISDIQSYQKEPQFIKVEDLWKDYAPLSVIARRAGQLKPIADDNFFHLEEDEYPQNAQTHSSSHNSTVTTLNLASGQAKNVRKYDILQVATTREQVWITDVNVAADTATMVRGHGGTTAATIPASAYLQIFSASSPAGTVAPTGFDDTPARKLNYLQITKEAIELDGRELEIATYGNTSGRNRAWKKCMSRLYGKREKTLMFGALDDATTAGHAKATGGLTHWISNHVIDASGGFTVNVLNQWLEQITRFNQNLKEVIVFAGTNFLAHLDNFAHDRLEMRPEDTEYGIAITRYKSSFGSLKIVKHGMFNDSYDPSTSYAGYALAVNMEYFKIANFKNRAMMINKGKQTADLDGIKDYILDDFGAYVAAERRHGWIYGIPALF